MDYEAKSNGPSTPLNVVEKVLAGVSYCDNSPYRSLPNFSTPPSKVTKIKNPFEYPLLETLDRPICSPGMFAKSTPNKDGKFKWSICDISNLKPAEFDENTLDHVLSPDPSAESVLQDRISSYFKENSIVPSPFNEEIPRKPLVKLSKKPHTPVKFARKLTSYELNDMFLSDVPKDLHEIATPYSPKTPEKDEDKDPNEKTYCESTFYNRLFNFEDRASSIESSPALSTGHSPIEFSPLRELANTADCSFGKSSWKGGAPSELDDCGLSPIKDCDVVAVREDRRRSSYSKSACRLDFTGHMSVDHGLGDNLVPDVLNQMSNSYMSFEEAAPNSAGDAMAETTFNWDLEYKHVSFVSKDDHHQSMDVSSAPNTPNSKLFTSHQRKRLSDNFKLAAQQQQQHLEDEIPHIQQHLSDNPTNENHKIRLISDCSDFGYHTGHFSKDNNTTTCWNDSNLFASTPTKHN